MNAVEAFTVKTSKRKTVPYDFGKDFYKFPSYLRRAAIAQAVGKVSSYKSNLKDWEASVKLATVYLVGKEERERTDMG